MNMDMVNTDLILNWSTSFKEECTWVIIRFMNGDKLRVIYNNKHDDINTNLKRNLLNGYKYLNLQELGEITAIKYIS